MVFVYLEPEICQQYFEIQEFDEQNKPLKISNLDYFEVDKSLYKVKDLSNSNNITTLGIDDDSKYQPLVSEKEIEKSIADKENLEKEIIALRDKQNVQDIIQQTVSIPEAQTKIKQFLNS